VPFKDTDDDIGWLRQSELENENPLPQFAVVAQVSTTLPPQGRTLPQFPPLPLPPPSPHPARRMATQTNRRVNAPPSISIHTMIAQRSVMDNTGLDR